jgi:Xaa-Pro aminopeptidase
LNSWTRRWRSGHGFRIARSGPNTLLTYHDECADRRITEDDIVYLDFGPVFEEWEADFGRTFVVGPDPVKHRLVGNLADAFNRGKELYRRTPNLEELLTVDARDADPGLAPPYLAG